MAYTQAHVDAMREALASGALSVSHGGKTVTYRSRQEMLDQLALMEAAIAGAGARRAHYAIAGHRRGGC